MPRSVATSLGLVFMRDWAENAGTQFGCLCLYLNGDESTGSNSEFSECCDVGLLCCHALRLEGKALPQRDQVVLHPGVQNESPWITFQIMGRTVPITVLL